MGSRERHADHEPRGAGDGAGGAPAAVALLAVLWWKMPIGVPEPAPAGPYRTEIRGKVENIPHSEPIRVSAKKDLLHNSRNEPHSGQPAAAEIKNRPVRLPHRTPRTAGASRGTEVLKSAGPSEDAEKSGPGIQKRAPALAETNARMTAANGHAPQPISLPEKRKTRPNGVSSRPTPQSATAAAERDSQGAKASPLRIHELPAALREEASRLEINIHAYYDDPSKCLVFINMEPYREGDHIGEGGPLIERITPKGVIVEYGSTRALLEIGGR